MNVDVAYIDVTDIPDVKMGDTVTIIGKDGDDEITSMELGEVGGTSQRPRLLRDHIPPSAVLRQRFVGRLKRPCCFLSVKDVAFIGWNVPKY